MKYFQEFKEFCQETLEIAALVAWIVGGFFIFTNDSVAEAVQVIAIFGLIGLCADTIARAIAGKSCTLCGREGHRANNCSWTKKEDV